MTDLDRRFNEIFDKAQQLNTPVQQKGNCEEKAQETMEIFVSYREIRSYVAERFHQSVALSFVNKKEIKVTYAKRVLIKELRVNVNLCLIEVRPDSVTLSYNGKFGIDKVIERVLNFLKNLTSGIHPEDNSCIRINLWEMEKTRALVENGALQDIEANEDGLRIVFTHKDYAGLPS